MTKRKIKESDILRDLGDGLIMRRAVKRDKNALLEFNIKVHGDFVKHWIIDLMNGKLPTFQPGDFIIVEDTNTGAIVSSLNHISQTWAYEGVPFGVGRVELVGTLEDYRRRGLVRAQMEVLHELSAARGEKAQGITGIPWYYRQFGYEMGLDLGGMRMGYKPHIPKLKRGEKDPYSLRAPKEEDIPFIMKAAERRRQRQPITCVRDEEIWRYEIFQIHRKSMNHGVFRIIETREGEAVGFIIHSNRLWGPTLACHGYELKEGVSWVAVTPSVVRYLGRAGKRIYKRDQGDREFGAWGFNLGADHPVYHAFDENMPRKHDPYAWYIRVADVGGFIKHVKRPLERRLKDSYMSGHTGETKINFYKSGVKLAFENGKLKKVEDWKPTPKDEGDILFPNLTFIQLLFGYRTFREIEHAYADCYARNDTARALIEILFPQKPSHINGIE